MKQTSLRDQLGALPVPGGSDSAAEPHTGCSIPSTRRLKCGHCPHQVCQDCDRCPCSCQCGKGGEG